EHKVLHFSFDEVLQRLRKTFEPIGCTRCQRCVCPHGHEIHTSFRQFNYYNLGKEFWAINKLCMDLKQTYQHCLTCTEHNCMKHCPQQIYIPEEIERIYELIKAFGMG
ncbi:MAG: hypothetical protein VZQ51_01685, partial [Bacteroidales bacterium]|nr:hypothetical protein [Bacteroidales bacterium]